jgi:hypothetical protein
VDTSGRCAPDSVHPVQATTSNPSPSNDGETPRRTRLVRACGTVRAP